MRELVCIGCPMGCLLQVDSGPGKILEIRGHACPRGCQYAKDEINDPRRMVTSLIQVAGSRVPLSVRTRTPIPKTLIKVCLQEIRRTKVTLPVKIGDVIIHDLLKTGTDLIATRNLPEPDLTCRDGTIDA